MAGPAEQRLHEVLDEMSHIGAVLPGRSRSAPHAASAKVAIAGATLSYCTAPTHLDLEAGRFAPHQDPHHRPVSTPTPLFGSSPAPQATCERAGAALPAADRRDRRHRACPGNEGGEKAGKTGE